MIILCHVIPIEMWKDSKTAGEGVEAAEGKRFANPAAQRHDFQDSRVA